MLKAEKFQESLQPYIKGIIGGISLEIKELKIPLPPLDIQRQIVAEIEAERAMVEANRKLAEVFEKKIQARLAEIWGEE